MILFIADEQCSELSVTLPIQAELSTQLLTQPRRAFSGHIREPVSEIGHSFRLAIR
jgi:hypothetical protein